MANKIPAEIDYSVGKQEFLDIEYKTTSSGSVEYVIRILGPDKAGLHTIRSDKIRDKTSIALLIANEMAKDQNFGFGQDQRPYRWIENRWQSVEKWFASLDYSMHALLRIPAQRRGSGDSLLSETLSAWRAHSTYDIGGLKLRAFGNCPGIPFLDSVLALNFGHIELIPHAPTNLNTRVIPISAQEAFENYFELNLGLHEDSQLMRFLRSTLDSDQLIAIRRWFGYHLTSNVLPNAEKLLYMFGAGGNGKSQILWLIRGLVGADACAEMRLSDLKIPANLELLVGKLAMIGGEASTKTELDILKNLVSREPFSCNPKYRDPFKIQPECLISQASNCAPHFDDPSDAMVRRTVALHLKNSFVDREKRIEDLAAKIIEQEYPLLVGFALLGAQELSEMGRFDVPESIRKASELAMLGSNPMAAFGSLLEFGPFETEERELYQAYKRWRLESGVQPENNATFKEHLVQYASKIKRHIEVGKRLSAYTPSEWTTERQEKAFVCPPLADSEARPYGYRGIRVADGHFGGAIGQVMPEGSRTRNLFEVDSSHESD